ncbi:hypothetical protein CI102_4139 [Trichoderma harzianum]|uniref:Uncharacterized protein n=1 Tax=Trichoderma harzianum CBS 226.95 TaxID=983964 RepID=A0A2T3ZXD7_TRIHA|nr:hypothetical protein M431DRAFT_500254 [Trichoderma harzianum CBS 226.95]PKK53048.1 hypothetical protein CI102_4139 [Trichoderma harzianum]PTB49475.1 hypothetical protein M431DRAFT_500254 [Trichoderma harzianum CBS 226.95]
MNDNPGEDQFQNPPGFFYVALTEAIADNDEDLMDEDVMDEDMMALEEATLQDDSSTESLDHDADDIATEREQVAIYANMRAARLEGQLERARAEVKKLNRPLTLDDVMPVLELYRQLIRIVRPDDFDREKWIRSHERCLGLQRRLLEKGEVYRLIQGKCETMREKCGGLLEKCVAICEYYDKFQERINSLFEEDEEEDEELYDMMRGKMGANEQRIEGLLDEGTTLMQMIEERMLWAYKLERKSAYNIYQLRRFEGILDDILQSFDDWFGEL